MNWILVLVVAGQLTVIEAPTGASCIDLSDRITSILEVAIAPGVDITSSCLEIDTGEGAK